MGVMRVGMIAVGTMMGILGGFGDSSPSTSRLLSSSSSSSSFSAVASMVNITLPKVALNGVAFEATVQLPPYFHGVAWPKRMRYMLELEEEDDQANPLIIEGEIWTVGDDGNANLVHTLKKMTVRSSGVHAIKFAFSCQEEDFDFDHRTECPSFIINERIHSMPGFLSLTPPMLTVFMAMWLKQVFIALILGIWLGAFYVHQYNPLIALLRTFDTYFAKVINYESGHAQVIVCCFLLGGLIGMVQKGGGAQGLGKFVTQFTTSRFHALLAVMLLNVLIFFDDYSAILIVGTTFSRIIKELYISNEKFAFVIHGISACFVSIVPISSWVGVQIGYIRGQKELEFRDPFYWFMESIPYRFFPLLWLAFLFINVLSGRDFGPMLECERKCYQKGKHLHSRLLEKDAHFSPLLKLGKSGDREDQRRRSLELAPEDEEAFAFRREESGPLVPKSGTPLDRWFNAVIPFSVVAISTFLGMYVDGRNAIHGMPVDVHVECTLINVFTHANSFNALMWGSMFGCLTALCLLMYQQILTLGEAMDAWVAGIATNILSPIIILLLAWALGQVINDISASTYLAESIGHHLHVSILPTIVLLLSFMMSFSTGTAFGSMGIMFPLVIPLASTLSHENEAVLSHCIGSILGGSLFGNVLSPIADDTILTSASASVTVEAHVGTMLPYVALVSLLSIVLCAIPVGLGVYGPWIALFVSISALIVLTLLFGSKVEDEPRANPSSRSSEKRLLLPSRHTE